MKKSLSKLLLMLGFITISSSAFAGYLIAIDCGDGSGTIYNSLQDDRDIAKEEADMLASYICG